MTMRIFYDNEDDAIDDNVNHGDGEYVDDNVNNGYDVIKKMRFMTMMMFLWWWGW